MDKFAHGKKNMTRARSVGIGLLTLGLGPVSGVASRPTLARSALRGRSTRSTQGKERDLALASPSMQRKQTEEVRRGAASGEAGRGGGWKQGGGAAGEAGEVRQGRGSPGRWIWPRTGLNGG